MCEEQITVGRDNAAGVAREDGAPMLHAFGRGIVRALFDHNAVDIGERFAVLGRDGRRHVRRECFAAERRHERLHDARTAHGVLLRTRSRPRCRRDDVAVGGRAEERQRHWCLAFLDHF